MTTLIITIAVITVVAAVALLGDNIVKRIVVALGKAAIRKASEMGESAVGKASEFKTDARRSVSVRYRWTLRKLWINWRNEYLSEGKGRMYVTTTLGVGALIGLVAILTTGFMAALPLLDPSSFGYAAGDALRVGGVVLAMSVAFTALLLGGIYGFGLVLMLLRVAWSGSFERLENYVERLENYAERRDAVSDAVSPIEA